MPVQLSILFSIATAMVLLFHNVLFKEEPEKKTHIVVNVLACLISASFYAWISSLANSITFRTSFNVAFQAYFYFGIISTIIIVPALTYFFGVKLNSKTEILRR
ncbi:MAG TPA: hypothetical protein VKU94_02115 [Geobacterales bacterium]|nr:hypothetical protein [Geobacterales bacterium]